MSNYHFRQLTASPWVLQPPQPNLDQVFSFVDGMLCYYVCEYSELSMRYFRRALGIAGIPTENVTQKEGAVRASDLDAPVFSALMEMNRLDMAIYRHAVDRLLNMV